MSVYLKSRRISHWYWIVSPRGTGTRVRDPRCGLADEGCGTLAHSTHREGKHGQKDRSKTFTGKMAQHSAGLAQRVGLCGSLWSLVAALLRVKHTRPAEVCPVTWLRQAGRGSVTSGEGQSGNARQRTAQTPCRSRRAVVQEHRERRPGVSATGWQQRILHVFREKKKAECPRDTRGTVEAVRSSHDHSTVLLVGHTVYSTHSSWAARFQRPVRRRKPEGKKRIAAC